MKSTQCVFSIVFLHETRENDSRQHMHIDDMDIEGASTKSLCMETVSTEYKDATASSSAYIFFKSASELCPKCSTTSKSPAKTWPLGTSKLFTRHYLYSHRSFQTEETNSSVQQPAASDVPPSRLHSHPPTHRSAKSAQADRQASQFPPRAPCPSQ